MAEDIRKDDEHNNSKGQDSGRSGEEGVQQSVRSGEGGKGTEEDEKKSLERQRRAS